ncbi:leucine-rich repeat-containing protein 7-like [Haliotis rufescens]|uniref:leucine-rich repeat-containing protein 7-like n=1 Tax=Haliotis rufescens TaxID=6454 RepID=UPI00201F6F27|nr:leucine-rich repeat-containing protein 7-like [Haliotis rufescens]
MSKATVDAWLDHASTLPRKPRIRLRVVTNSKGYVELDLHNRNLSVVPPEVFQFTRIEVLKLSHNKLEQLPVMLSYLRGLRLLQLQNNLITSLPQTLINCKHLTELNLTNNRLSSLPKSVCSLHLLKVLQIGENDLEQIPHEVGLLTNLKHLDLHQNKLWYLPFSIQSLSKLLFLNLANNLLDQVPVPVCKLSSLHVLNLSQNRLAALPPDFDSLKQLRELNISLNQFTSLNTMVTRMRHLKFLNISKNRLTVLPNELTRLQALRVLHVQGNKLTTIPDKFDNLQYLNISSNDFTSFSVSRMKNLICLNAAHNKLESLPQGIFDLTHLKYLRMEQNKIYDINPQIVQLTKLQTLDLSYNKINALPDNMYKLENLHKFNIKGNTIVHVKNMPKNVQPEKESKRLFGIFKKKDPVTDENSKSNTFRSSRPLTRRPIPRDGSKTLGHNFSKPPPKGNRRSRSETLMGRMSAKEYQTKGKKSALEYQTKELSTLFLEEDSMSLDSRTSIRTYRSEPNLTKIGKSPDSGVARTEPPLGDLMPQVTDYTLLGVCNQLEMMLNKQLLHPVIANNTIGKRFSDDRTIQKTQTGVWRLSQDATVENYGLEYSQPETFTITQSGGSYVSSFDSRIQVTAPTNAFINTVHATLQVLRIKHSLLAKIKSMDRYVENLLAFGPVIYFKLLESQAVINSAVTITIPAPPEMRRGHLMVVTVRADNSCTPCSSGYQSAKGAVTFNAWHLTGKVAVVTKAKCKYKACKSVEELLQSLGVRQKGADN